MVQILSRNAECHQKWIGFAETRVRKIVYGLEKLDSKINNHAFEIRPFTKSYENVVSHWVPGFEC
jgi:poly(A) polymerase Pap1